MSIIKSAARQIRERLGAEGRMTVLTGAGISAESGVPTFRGMGGVWERYDVMDLATPEAFARDPRLVHRFYNDRRSKLGAVAPNPGHRALAEAERLMGERFALVTQNVDDLHERAGSQRLWHMHGELKKARCVRCGVPVVWTRDLSLDEACERCSGQLRPHIVWFGEVPLFMDEPIPQLLDCAVFLSVGTSGVVYPAAGFAATARSRGALTLHVNVEPSGVGFDVDLIGPAGVVLPELVSAISEDHF